MNILIMRHGDAQRSAPSDAQRILTDKGMLDVPVVGKVKENPNSQIFICKKCGREIKSRLAFANHYKACKGETK